jgi:hypothetical protein
MAVLLFGLAAPASAQTTPETARVAMPRLFSVTDLEIRLSHQEGSAAYRPRELTIAGSGDATLTQAGNTWQLQRKPADALALLNELYRIRFFDLPETYGKSDFAVLGANGTVRLVEQSTSSSGGKRICVRIATFHKCVRFGPEGPVELDRILLRTLDDAELGRR